MENNIKKKSWIGLFFYLSILTLAGCNGTANNLGMREKEVQSQAIVAAKSPRIATGSATSKKITGEGSLIRSMLMLTLLAQVVPGAGSQPVDVGKWVRRLASCKPTTLSDGTCEQKLDAWVRSCRALDSWKLVQIGHDSCEQEDYLAPYVGELTREHAYCIRKCNLLLSQTLAAAKVTGMEPPKNRRIRFFIRPLWTCDQSAPCSPNELRRVVNGSKSGDPYGWEEIPLVLVQSGANEIRYVVADYDETRFRTLSGPLDELARIKQEADGNPIKQVQLLRESGLLLLDEQNQDHGNFKQWCDDPSLGWHDAAIGLLKSINYDFFGRANKLQATNELAALAQNATECAKVEKMMQASAVANRQRHATPKHQKQHIPRHHHRNHQKHHGSH